MNKLQQPPQQEETPISKKGKFSMLMLKLFYFAIFVGACVFAFQIYQIWAELGFPNGNDFNN
ncbi:MAG: hypothetical protein KF836_02530 [Fimbriimonadaceae bacterium]|nr:hypothetical protein [Fimbriimonadaceae bacterium]